MLLTIHNLPAATRYADIKSLLQSKCGLQHVILDNLIGEGSGKKVTVGVAEDADAAILVRKINGLFWNGQQLYVEDVRRQKSASDQPYRKSMPETKETTRSFQPMNLQQHSSYPKGVPVPMEMAPAPAVQPMMAAMYYDPNNKYMQSFSGMQTNFVQNVDQTQNLQNSFMGMGNGQNTQTEAVPQYDFSSAEAQNRSLPWEESYNEGNNFTERPVYKHRSPVQVNWVLNDSPQRDQSWAGGNVQPDFRPNRLDDRPGFNKPRSDERPGFKPRPDVRSNKLPSLLATPTQPRSVDQRPFQQEFVLNNRPRMDERFPKRPNDFGRSNERNEWGPNGRRGPEEFSGQNDFSGRPNEFSGRYERRGPNDFSGRPNEFAGRSDQFGGQKGRRDHDEFSGGSNDFSRRHNEHRGPNEFSGRPNDFSGGPNERRGPNEFSGRPNDRSGPNEISGRPNERHGPNQFSDRANDFSGRPNQSRGPKEFTGRPNERRGPNDFSGGMNERGHPNISRRSNDRHGPPQFAERPNQQRGPNVFTRKPNEFSSGPNGRPNYTSNEHQNRSNEVTGRKGRPNERGISKPNREFARSNERNELNRPFNRPEFPRCDRPERNLDLNPRKRKFEEKTEEIDRPIRVSRPIPAKLKRRFDSIESDALTDVEKAKLAKQMFLAGVRRIVYEIRINLGIQDMDWSTKQTFKKLIYGRMESILEGSSSVHPEKCYEIYRTMYPKMGDKTTYETVLAMVSKSGPGTIKEAAKPKAKAKPKSVKAKPNAVKAKPTLQPKQTKYEREMLRRQIEASSLLAQGKLPSFPQGDKRLVAQQRKEEKVGHIPDVEEKYKVAIEEELNNFTDLFIRELNNAPTAKLQQAYDTVDQTQLVEEIKHNLKQHLCRRISNTGLKVVRIYGFPKLPTRAVLEQALTKFGVLSLRKSTKTKMYTASVNTYENFDKLCAKDSITVADGFSISFKPFHLAVKERADQRLLRTMRKKIIDDMIEKTELNLLDKDWPEREAEINAAKAADEAKAALEADAKTSVAETAKEVKDENKKIDDTEHKDGDGTENETKDVTNEYVNDDFQVIDEVNESDSDIDFTDVGVKEVNLNSDNEENNGNIDDSNENANEISINVGKSNDNVDVSNGTVDESKGNDVIECKKEMEDAVDEFDIDNVDVDIDDFNEDDLEDY